MAMASSKSPTDLVSDLMTKARSAPLAAPHFAALGSSAPVEHLAGSLKRALDEGEIHAATALALAIGAAGGRIAPELALRLVPDLESIENLPIVASIIEGESLTTLLDLVERGTLSWEREGLTLYLATQLLDGREPPRRLIAMLRSLAREPISGQARLLVGLAARALRDPELDSLTSEILPLAAAAEKQGMGEALRAGLFRPVLESLPEEAPRLVSGYTVIRSAPKVGRNNPCPCGSGRKYKKCCAERQEGAAPPSRVEQFQKLASRGGRVQREIFDEMRPAELAQLDPERLTTLQLIHAVRKLACHRRWDAAERFMDVLSTRDDAPDGDPNGHRLDLADDAFQAGELEIAERQIARSELTETKAMSYRVKFALARNTPDALVQLESRLRAGHERDDSLLIEGAFALLDSFPALGILAARGCISAERLLDSETLLTEIDRARDRLGLSAHEPWWEMFDLVLDERLGPRDPRHARADDGESRQREREIEKMRSTLEAANARVSRLDEELARRVEQLEALTQEREQLAAIVQASHGEEYGNRVSELEEERKRLRNKIVALQGEISEGAAQRADLRRELARTADAVEKKSRRDEHVEERDEEGDDEGEPASARPRRILVPHYTPAAARSLSAVPARVAADALQETSLLAGGDAHVWSGVKQMRRAHDILSARIGRSYRLLFRFSDERLEVLDLIHRRDLESALQRLAR